jgi:hypothetical protein
MAFTTWSALLTSLKNDLAGGTWARKQYSTPDGSSVTYRDIDEFLKFYRFVEDKAGAESSSSGHGGSFNYAKFGGAS